MPDIFSKMKNSFDVKKNKNEVVCPNCGGVFHIDEPKCPYCGTMNPQGAEKEYIGKLYDIKEDTEDLTEIAKDEVSANLKHNSKKIFRLLGVVAVIALIIVGITAITKRKDSDNAMEEYKAREAFKATYFAELDRLHDEGKEEELVEFTLGLVEEPGYSAIYTWDHFGYLDACYYYTEMGMWMETYKESGDAQDLAHAIYPAVELTRGNYLAYHMGPTLTEEDIARIEEFKTYAEEFLEENLDMTKEELDAWVDEVKDGKDYIDRKKLEEAVKTLLS